MIIYIEIEPARPWHVVFLKEFATLCNWYNLIQFDIIFILCVSLCDAMETVRSVWNLKTRIIDFSGSHNLNWSQFPEQVVPSLINAYTPFAPQIRCRSHSFEWLHPSMSMLSIRATRALIWYDWLIFVDPVYLFDLLGFRGHAQVLPKYGIEATEKGTSIMAALDLRVVYKGTLNIALLCIWSSFPPLLPKLECTLILIGH